ncbi:Sol2 protein [Martiniozyma asiatica (nom. inval.)]|nr:Sol2 protein [Martiniozyma asiatica]
MTTVPTLYVFPELLGVSEALTDFILTQQNHALEKPNKRFKIALSGGSLLHVLHTTLLHNPHVNWDKWDIWFVDERIVSQDDNDSNSGTALRLLLNEVMKNGKRPNVYTINYSMLKGDEIDLQEIADQYESLLVRNFAGKDSVRLPQFDLILLGCAPDGHVASLFPGHTELREKDAWIVPVENAPCGPKQRITFTLPVISHAKMVAFVVEGATKAKVMQEIMERPDKGLPGSIINEKAAGRIVWFVDEEAVVDVVARRKRYAFTNE